MTPESKEKVKKLGLKAAEDHLVLGLDEAIAIGEIMVNDTSNSFDNMALEGIKHFKQQLIEFIDKIDGVDNQG